LNTRPLVSVVTATLNRAELLKHTLRSVQRQTYPNVEHIVVDGGSTDDTLHVLRRYQSMYRLRWMSGPDAGMYQAINRGLREAEGEILAYLNSDDLYFPWSIEVVVETFAKSPDADLVFGDAIAIDDSSGRQSLNFQPPFDTDYIRRWGFLCQPAVFWRRRVWEEEGGFDESLRFVADCDYWMRTGGHRRFVKTNEFLAIERNHPMTLRAVESPELAAELATVRARYVDMTGIRHRLATLHHRARALAWALWLLGVYALKSTLPRPLVRGAWSRLLMSGRSRIRWYMVPLRILPGIDRRRTRLVKPSRYWLEPPAADG
jgi:glycosyltransferase involved in cell wall biosynthesis